MTDKSIPTDAANIYSFSVKKADGSELPLQTLAGKVLLIVNVASKCGFTSQYSGLEALYKKHKEQGFEILGFPCNQFGGQEPGSEAEIQGFCELNFGVTFPLCAKVEVNGDNAIPLYAYLKSQAKGLLNTEAIKWNFTKFLIARDGKVLDRYAPNTSPDAIEADIVKALAN